MKLSELPDDLLVTTTNRTKDTITTGEHFRIQKFEHNKWVDIIPNNIAFHDIGYDLPPEGTKTFTKKLFKTQINYKSGKYRIIKYYLKSDYLQTKENFNTSREFEIE